MNVQAVHSRSVHLDSYSPLVNRKYILPRSLVANLSKNMMTLRLGLISSDRLKLLEAIVSAVFRRQFDSTDSSLASKQVELHAQVPCSSH